MRPWCSCYGSMPGCTTCRHLLLREGAFYELKYGYGVAGEVVAASVRKHARLVDGLLARDCGAAWRNIERYVGRRLGDWKSRDPAVDREDITQSVMKTLHVALQARQNLPEDISEPAAQDDVRDHYNFGRDLFGWIAITTRNRGRSLDAGHKLDGKRTIQIEFGEQLLTGPPLGAPGAFRDDEIREARLFVLTWSAGLAGIARDLMRWQMALAPEPGRMLYVAIDAQHKLGLNIPAPPPPPATPLHELVGTSRGVLSTTKCRLIKAFAAMTDDDARREAFATVMLRE